MQIDQARVISITCIFGIASEHACKRVWSRLTLFIADSFDYILCKIFQFAIKRISYSKPNIRYVYVLVHTAMYTNETSTCIQILSFTVFIQKLRTPPPPHQQFMYNSMHTLDIGDFHLLSLLKKGALP